MLIDTGSPQERSQYEVFSKFISKHNSFLAEKYSVLGFQGILFEKHWLILFMCRPNLNTALFSRSSTEDTCEDGDSTKYSFKIQKQPTGKAGLRYYAILLMRQWNTPSHSICLCKRGNPLQRSPLLSWVSQERVKVNLNIAGHS